MNCLIVDDNKMSRAVLSHQIADIDFLTLVGECENVMQATSILNTEKIDLMFLDIQMPKISGIDFLRNVANLPMVILISSRPEYALEAFEYNVVDYIIKPLKADRFLKAIMKAKEVYDKKSNPTSTEKEKEYFFFREKGVASKLKFADIHYIQANGDYITIFTDAKNYTIHSTMNSIEKELPNDKFLRVHRSYIIALDKIETVEDNTAYINKKNIPIGDKQKSSLMERINLL